jgi:phosphoribosylaminoimidazole-succinocarboxamide synthase
VEAMRRWTMRVNILLSALFAKANLILVDFKLEFGRFDGELYLGDEFSPDGCRLWDARSLEKMDKDRFRRNLGGVVEAYIEVARRLGVPLPAVS